ncbi:hypothetical protein [Cryobacterium sp. N19]|uniref:hypothetical protein n=1 Tax=Cryobacterium sp. N19 TaxID=2048288 RepID=UPI000CE45110|nr:hypothetical protein [Cryobacterium sp. N19]
MNGISFDKPPQPSLSSWADWQDLVLHSTTISEGLTALVDSGRISDLPELANTIGVPQDARWLSAGDVFKHLGLAADAAARAAAAAGLANVQ